MRHILGFGLLAFALCSASGCCCYCSWNHWRGSYSGYGQPYGGSWQSYNTVSPAVPAQSIVPQRAGSAISGTATNFRGTTMNFPGIGTGCIQGCSPDSTVMYGPGVVSGGRVNYSPVPVTMPPAPAPHDKTTSNHSTAAGAEIGIPIGPGGRPLVPPVTN